MSDIMKYLRTLTLALVVLSMLGIALAADITSDSNDVEARLIITNAAPQIDSVTPGSATYDPVEAGTTSIVVYFVASDPNGVAELDDSTAKLNITNGGTSHVNNTCTVVDLDATRANYTCSLNLQYYDNFGNWNINVSIEDTEGASTYDDTEIFYYSKLAALNLTRKQSSFSLWVSSYEFTFGKSLELVNPPTQARFEESNTIARASSYPAPPI